jgi:hypothetical protein
MCPPVVDNLGVSHAISNIQDGCTPQPFTEHSVGNFDRRFADEHLARGAALGRHLGGGGMGMTMWVEVPGLCALAGSPSPIHVSAILWQVEWVGTSALTFLS